MPTVNISNFFPIRFGSIGMLVVMRATLGIACLAPIAALAQRDMGCSPTWPTPAPEARAVLLLRVEGVLFGTFFVTPRHRPLNKRERSEALTANHEAIEYKDPSDPIIRQNLANAQQGLAKAQEEQAQLRIQAQEKASAERMSKSFQDWSVRARSDRLG